MAIQVIEYTGTVPNREGDSPTDFANNVYNYQVWINNFVPSFNSSVDSINADVTTINNAKNEAVNAQIASETARDESVSAKDTAVAKASEIQSYVIPSNATYDASTIDTKIYDSVPYAQHGLIPNDGVNEIRPADMFTEVDVANVLVDKKGYPVRFTDGVYDRLGNELVTNGDFSNGTSSWSTNCTLINGVLTGGSYIYQLLNLSNTKSYILTYYADKNHHVTLYGNGGHNSAQYNPSIGWNTVILSPKYPNSRLQFESFTNLVLDNVSVRELPQWQLPKAPFATGSTDELLDDKVNGLTTQTAHSKGDIVVTGNELVTNGTFDSDFTLNDGESGNGWAVTQGTAVASGGEVTLKGTDDYPTFKFDNSNITDGGNSYIVKLDVKSVTSGFAIEYYDGSGYHYINLQVGDDQTVVLTGSNGSNITQIRFGKWGNGGVAVIDNISVKLKDQSYIALQDTTAGDLLTDTTKFKPIPYVTKQVALLIEKTSAGTILNTVKPLVNMYGEESVETYEADIFGELGYSQKADRVWTDGSSEFILVGLKGYLNAAAYHPFYNPFGCGSIHDETDTGVDHWYYGAHTNIYTLFDPKDAYTSSLKGWCYNFYNGSISQKTYDRPDSKFYDKTYIEGQGGLICYAIPNAKTPTYKHKEEVRRNLVDGYIENGIELLRVERYHGLSYYAYTATRTGVYMSSYCGLYYNYSVGDRIQCFYIDDNGISTVLSGTVHSKSHGYIIVIDHPNFSTSFTTGSNQATKGYFYIPVKSPYLATQGTTTHTDLIGDPAPYKSSDATYISPTSTSITDMPTNTLVWDNATGKMYKAIIATNDLDANGLPVPAFTDTTAWTQVKKGYPQELRNLLASGKGVGFMNALLVGQDGSDYTGASTSLIMSKKNTFDLSNNISNLLGFNGSILQDSSNLEGSSNSVTNTLALNSTWANYDTKLIQYTSQNQPAIPITTPKAIEAIDNFAITTDSNDITKYNGLMNTVSGVIQTGTSEAIFSAITKINGNVFSFTDDVTSTTPTAIPFIASNNFVGVFGSIDNVIDKSKQYIKASSIKA